MLIRVILLLLFFLNNYSYGAYIDQRDLSTERSKVQRLLGQLDALKAYPQNSNSGNNQQTLALLGIATAGLAIAAASDTYYYDRYYVGRPYPGGFHRPPYHRPYPVYGVRRHRNEVGTAVGATVAAIGLIGAIASASAASAEQENALSRQEEIKNIEQNISDIISNLIITDVDYLSEKSNLTKTLVEKTDKDILDINILISNKMLLAKQEPATSLSNFIVATNRLAVSIQTVETSTLDLIAKNITTMQNSSTSRAATRELKALNKELKKQSKKRVAEIKKQLKSEVKNFNKLYPKIQNATQARLKELETEKNKLILAELEYASNQENAVFQKFKSLYIAKLAAY